MNGPNEIKVQVTRIGPTATEASKGLWFLFNKHSGDQIIFPWFLRLTLLRTPLLATTIPQLACKKPEYTSCTE